MFKVISFSLLTGLLLSCGEEKSKTPEEIVKLDNFKDRLSYVMGAEHSKMVTESGDPNLNQLDYNALIDGLNNDKISGYLTDVLEVEPISNNEHLVGIKNTIITPHVGSRTYQSVEKQALMSIKNLINCLN